MAPSIGTGHAYYITNAKSGATLDLSGEDGFSIIGNAFNGTPNQQWTIESVGEGLRTLKCVRNGKYLGYRQPLQADTIATGVETAVKWTIVQEEENTYRIFASGIWLQLSSKYSEPGACVQLSYPLPDRSQTWKIITAGVTNMRLVTYDVEWDGLPDKITLQDTLKALPDPLIQPKYLSVQGPQPWSARRVRVAETLLCYTFDIACLQEVWVRHHNDLSQLLGNDWGWVGVGGDIGVEKVRLKDVYEFNPMCYRKSAFKLLSTDTFWLTNDPFEPSQYPGTYHFRMCTTARFFSMDSGKEFTILSTHLDCESHDQRRLGASMLLVRARYEAMNTSGPVFVLGRFYSSPRDDAYNIMTGSLPPVSVNPSFANKYAVKSDQLPNFCMLDLRGTTPWQSVSTNYATFTDFTAPNDTGKWERMDYIFGGNNMGWSSRRYFVGTSLSDDGMLASDSRPVFADISI